MGTKRCLPKRNLPKRPLPERATDMEDLYVLERIDWKRRSCRVRKVKAADDDYTEESGYVINEGQCSCPAFHFHSDCKHVQMLDGLPPGNVVELPRARPLADEVLAAVTGEWDLPCRIGRVIGDVRRCKPLVRAIHLLFRIEPGTTAAREKRIVGWLRNQEYAGVPVVIDLRRV